MKTVVIVFIICVGLRFSYLSYNIIIPGHTGQGWYEAMLFYSLIEVMIFWLVMGAIRFSNVIFDNGK